MTLKFLEIVGPRHLQSSSPRDYLKNDSTGTDCMNKAEPNCLPEHVSFDFDYQLKYGQTCMNVIVCDSESVLLGSVCVLYD